MEENKWVDLDPTCPHSTLYEYDPGHHFCHRVYTPSKTRVVGMSHSEALVFACQLPEIKALLAIAQGVVEHINECNDELTVPTAEMADKLSVAIADVEGER